MGNFLTHVYNYPKIDNISNDWDIKNIFHYFGNTTQLFF